MRILAAILVLLLAGPAHGASPSPEPPVFPPSDGQLPPLPEIGDGLPPPHELLGHRPGERFTSQERQLDYLQHLADSSDRVTLWEYGRSYEDRPLVLVAVSAPGNLARLDEIRTQRLRHLADATPRGGPELPLVLWLAYGVHGNEASSPEAATAVVYLLAAARGEWADRLDEAIVLIDPMVNPDGHERYLQGFVSRRGRAADPHPSAAEHREPWPGGRYNHYLFDLNRDWAWASQQETRQRLAEYRRWEPQVFVDLHEMAPENTYFFPPSADPIHPAIDPRVVRWLAVFGEANAARFDERGWLYYAAERYDLFYPGYGDSYPSLRGAVGMTFEVGGSGRAGEQLRRPDGNLLTLADRVVRHLTTSLGTLQTAIDHRQELWRDLLEARRPDTSGPSAFLWDADAPEAGALAELLRRHGIELSRLESPGQVEVRPLAGGPSRRRSFPGDSYVLATDQRLGRLAVALMDRQAEMPEGWLAEQRDLLEQNRPDGFFDITAWSLPLAFNLTGWIADGALPATRLDRPPPPGAIRGQGSYGFLIPAQGLASHRAAARLMAADLRFRLALAPVTSTPGHFGSGALFVPGREGAPAEKLLGELAAEGLQVHRVSSGRGGRTPWLGSPKLPSIRPVHIALVGGSGVKATSFGAVWHLLDQEIGARITRLELDHLPDVQLGDFDVLVLPDGAYSGRLDSARLGSWVEAGGVLVAVGGAVSWLQAEDLSSVHARPAEEQGALEARDIDTPGAVLETLLAPRHEIGVGLAHSPWVLYNGSIVLEPTGDPGIDVLTAAADPVAAGFAWPEASERLSGSLLVASERQGRGRVILFARDPLFRGFWRGTAALFLNGVLYAPSLK